MNKPNSILRIFFCYLILNFLVIFFNLFYCEFDIEIIKNFFENSFFSLILIIPCVFIRKDRYKVAYSLLSFVFFSITVLIESVYYLIFQVFLSASSIFVIMDSNLNESYEFIKFYLGFEELVMILITLTYCVYAYKYLKNNHPSFKSITLKQKYIHFTILVASVFYLKVSNNIIFNFPYLFLKSSYEYYTTSKDFEANFKNNNGLFKNVKLSSGVDNNVYVLVIGESTVRSHMQLYGYKRMTTPRLAKISNQLLIYNDVISPNTLTIESITKMLTLANYESLDNNTSGSILQLANAAGFKTIWLSNQRPIGVFESLITKIALSSSEVQFITTAYGQHNRTLDQELIPKFNEYLDQEINKPLFVVIHLMGTHFKYENRYPDSLKNKFNSALNKSLSEKEKINNEYDRAVLNTDYVISEIISSVQQKASNSAVLYLSDHGEELDNLKFRGHNESFATKSMFEIPFFVWQSQENKKNNPLFFDNDRKYMSDDLFHTLADFLQINSDEVDSTRSIFSTSFKNRKRLVLDFQNYDSIFRN